MNVRPRRTLPSVGSNPDRRQPAHANAVRKAFPTLESLAEAGDDVRDLIAHPGWAHVCRLIAGEVQDLDAHLDGRLLEHTEYAFSHGQRRGLNALVDLAHAVVSVADQRLMEQRAKHEGTANAVPMGVTA